MIRLLLPARAAAALLTVLSLCASAAAQQAPAGNTHPQAEALRAANIANPFGEARKTTDSTQASKRSFAQAVDLTPLSDVAVYHNGRVKILGTLAGEMVSTIAARKNFFDVVPESVNGETKWRRVTYQPLFTYLDIIIDPAFYEDKALIGVPYHPLREEILSRVWTEQTVRPGERPGDIVHAWMKLGRLTPQMVMEQRGTLSPMEGGRISAIKSRAIGELEESVMEFYTAPRTLMLVPAAQPEQPWLHLGELKPDQPAAVAARALGDAWRKQDAAAVNAAARRLAEALPGINPSAYPTTRRSLESLYNRAHFFEWGMWLYCFATIFLLLAFGTGRPWLSRAGLALLIAAVVTHALGFGIRSYIAERYSIQNQFESMTGVSLFAALVGLVLMVFKKQKIFAAAAAGVGFLVLIAATQTGIPGKVIAREAAILNTSVLLKYHVTTVLLSYGLISLGFIVSLFYLGTYYASRAKARAGAATVLAAGPGGGAVSIAAAALNEPEDPAQPGAAFGVHRVLADLDKAQMTILQLAFWVLGVGILLGAWWADHSWGRWWGFDPKEMWALVTWLVYLVVVHVRVASAGNKGLKTAWLSVLGFIAMLWCYFGVNLLL
ncbi:MAG TPA: cytochrome c biogenesis protein CcsA, partial [Phycisphaerales bacterium]|nr:cytochrome c biogenesis protein CcsA [Phycisphaerales bacterium]